MGTLAQLIDNTKQAMASRIGAVLTLRKYGTAESDNQIETATLGPAGIGLAVEFADGATAPLPTGAATEATLAALATQATLEAVRALAATPTIPNPITPSDVTDTSALTAKGLLVGATGNLAVRGTGAPTVSVTIAVQAGQYVPLVCSRVMAATTATGIVGLA